MFASLTEVAGFLQPGETSRGGQRGELCPCCELYQRLIREGDEHRITVVNWDQDCATVTSPHGVNRK